MTAVANTAGCSAGASMCSRNRPGTAISRITSATPCSATPTIPYTATPIRPWAS
ncbi:Uncharacterised protein [Mycobacterium tuberculosis]|uniref:Uncharacterized protein n=1 Tax=Mycobacterium tuberculosis TaxID=1773 RepID=A0A916P6G4_MYCTX|nr:Uncharacterised protein [Mycobacterium tuberculosis]COW77610.1 Uncharacterised protein [Mycobacterium tuberculosis]